MSEIKNYKEVSVFTDSSIYKLGWRIEKNAFKFQANCVTMFYVIKCLHWIGRSILSLDFKQPRQTSYSNRYFRSSRPEVFYRNVFLEILQKSQENTCARVSFLIKLQLIS